ncbi:MAG TPA: lasso RiPP family leader peptide-containing protein [Jatrophihabitantaceae bacterium]|jgi:hypothetical protein|nr:lasso RiPP family leader peptide-containing protein [Jatrophihabitantaceae bacterium]
MQKHANSAVIDDSSEKIRSEVYAAPALVEVGGFAERTRGQGILGIDADGSYAFYPEG